MRKMCAGRGYGERNPHQVCRVSKRSKAGFELRRRNLLWKSVPIIKPISERLWEDLFIKNLLADRNKMPYN